MENMHLNAEGELVIRPSVTSAATDFDFLLGIHVVEHRKLVTRLAGSNEWIEFRGTHTQESLLGGLGNLEQQEMTPPDGYTIKGIALRLFNPLTSLWTIYWADNIYATLDKPVIGSFQDGIGYFFTRDKFNGQSILVQFKWDLTNPQHPVWSQAFSADEGKSWEWNWYMKFSRR